MSRTTERWAREEFGTAKLGDVRRTRRLQVIASGAAERPAGKVSVVFDRMEQREGAYDFLESEHVTAAAVAESMFAATVQRARGERAVYVVIDLSSLTLTDVGGGKGFGPIGSPNRAVRGLMVANGLAVSCDGVPLGLVDQQFWSREETERMPKDARTLRNVDRPFEEKQGASFVRVAENAIKRFSGSGTCPWVIVDREGDNRDILLALASMACAFTVRVSWNRRLDDDAIRLRESLASEPALLRTKVDVPRNGRRKARVATVEVRAKELQVSMSRRGDIADSLNVFAVSVKERGAASGRADALDWVLYTNIPVRSAEAALQIVEAYRARWRVEEFHRTWKKGQCNVEDAQLRSIEAVKKWATILSAVAVRIERLKYLARNKADLPADVELAAIEIDALKMERRDRTKNRRVAIPDMPSIGQATEWIAELGGWMGKRSSGPPGSITLARGLERLSIWVHALTFARKERSRE
jgi:hypothetical protein